MGGAAVLEVALLPRGKCLQTAVSTRQAMAVYRMAWNPQNMLDFFNDHTSNEMRLLNPRKIIITQEATPLLHCQGKTATTPIVPIFIGGGGLQPQIDATMRRDLAGP